MSTTNKINDHKKLDMREWPTMMDEFSSQITKNQYLQV